MARQAFRAFLQFLLTLFALLTCTFFLLRALPGGPFDRQVALAPDLRQELLARYGLDQPMPVQYGRYLIAAAQGNFGASFRFEGAPVSEIIGRGAPTSLGLGALALVLALAVGIPAGLESARRKDTWLDQILRLAGASALSLPAYFVGALLVYFFALRWELLPAALAGGPSHYVMPVVALSLVPMAQVARLVRASVLENLRADYVRTARAKGASEESVYWHHALRNSLLPLLSRIGPLAANLVAGTFVVETIFALPGLGRHFVESVANRDYPLVMGLTIFYGALLLSANLITEVLQGWADPRLGRGQR